MEQPKFDISTGTSPVATSTSLAGAASSSSLSAGPSSGTGSAAIDAVAAAPDTPQVSIDDFCKLDLRVGRVVSAEAVPKSRKLIKIQLETGGAHRQVVAGILGAYEPDALVGKLVIFIANLKPATLAGLESNGMILAASTDDGPPVLLTVEDDTAALPGAKVS